MAEIPRLISADDIWALLEIIWGLSTDVHPLLPEQLSFDKERGSEKMEVIWEMKSKTANTLA